MIILQYVYLVAEHKSYLHFNFVLGLIMPHLAGSFGVFLCRQFYLNFPKSLDDAASIDGCSKFRTYFEIYLPLSGPVLATLAVLKTTFSWNEYTWPLILTNTPDMMTVQLGLAYFRTEYNIQWNQLMGASLVVMLPILIMFVFMQKYFVKGVVNTGIKG
jgi:multiple sugar transport system permease protein